MDFSVINAICVIRGQRPVQAAHESKKLSVNSVSSVVKKLSKACSFVF